MKPEKQARPALTTACLIHFIFLRSDPFSLDMMPTNIPQLLMQLPDDDAPTEEE